MFANRKSCILNTNEPIIIKDLLKWDILNWSLEDWKCAFQNEQLEFRCGVNEATKEPQWERKTRKVKGDFNYFLNEAQNNDKEWLYFDYKQLDTWFTNVKHLRQEINWSQLGFPEIKPEDCIIWIGSKGAHTPCHMDTYGFNLVYQIYGKKLWLLFPPEENLKPTRIPYEESSVYSKLNFFSPTKEDFKGFSNKCRKVVLEPGDVLLVPNKWWHYVENLETSISVNVWLPLQSDDEERLKESLVQFFIKGVTELSKNDINNIILNPNMDEVILGNNLKHFSDTVNNCKRICNDKKVKKEDLKLDEENFYKNIPILSSEEFLTFIEQQNNRFCYNDNKNNKENNENDDYINIIESFTNPEVINVIKNIFLNK